MRVRSTKKIGLPVIGFGIAWTLCFAGASTACGHEIYWTEVGPDRLAKANDNGTGQVTLLSTSYQPRAIDVDANGGKMYWTNYVNGDVRRANLDGSDVQLLITTGTIENVLFDDVHQKLLMYDDDPVNDRAIFYQSNLDGSGLQTLFTFNRDGVVDFAIDPANQKIYWTNDQSGAAFPSGAITRANYDGTNLETLLTGSRFGWITLDAGNGQMYWSTVDTGDRRIQRANLNGSQVQTLITQANVPGVDTFLPSELGLDFANGKLYWINDKFLDDRFFKANFDGTQIQEAFNPNATGLIDFTLVVPEPNVWINCLVAFGAMSFVIFKRRLTAPPELFHNKVD
jgi:hypothetical protein